MSKLASLKYFFVAFLFFGGMSVFLYPAISGLINEQTQTAVVEEYRETVEGISESERAESLEQSRAYNESLVSNQTALIDPFGDTQESANEVISFIRVGEVMGYLEIPSIGAQLPIYEGTAETVLQKGVGWLTGTSLPVGGSSTHTVLTGHRGLPTSRLFTDLDKVEVGDEFFIRNASEILAYRVFNIQVIDPQDVSALEIVKGAEWATLLTCHPFMINSHRLLVTGERVAYTGQLDEKPSTGNAFADIFVDLTPVERDFTLAIVLAAVLTGLFILFILRSRKRQKKKRSVQNGQS